MPLSFDRGLADMSLQVLLVLLDCNVGRTAAEATGDGKATEPNVYQILLSQISSK